MVAESVELLPPLLPFLEIWIILVLNCKSHSLIGFVSHSTALRITGFKGFVNRPEV
jgi:hypothetical protein